MSGDDEISEEGFDSLLDAAAARAEGDIDSLSFFFREAKQSIPSISAIANPALWDNITKILNKVEMLINLENYEKAIEVLCSLPGYGTTEISNDVAIYNENALLEIYRQYFQPLEKVLIASQNQHLEKIGEKPESRDKQLQKSIIMGMVRKDKSVVLSEQITKCTEQLANLDPSRNTLNIELLLNKISAVIRGPQQLTRDKFSKIYGHASELMRLAQDEFESIKSLHSLTETNLKNHPNATQEESARFEERVDRTAAMKTIFQNFCKDLFLVYELSQDHELIERMA